MESLFTVIILILLVCFGVKGCADSSDLTQLENKVKKEEPFNWFYGYEYKCNLTEKGKKRQALEKELSELK